MHLPQFEYLRPNSLADAVGRPLNEMPISPWRLLRSLGRPDD